MTLQELLNARRSAVIKQWRQQIIDSYPEDARHFLKREKDRFANPVGEAIARETEALFRGLAAGEDPEALKPNLDSLIRIRAVQDFKPSEAIAFLFQLKDIVRREQSRAGEIAPEEIRSFEQRVDALALAAVDVYTECRQRLFDIRVNEVERQYRRLLSRAKILAEEKEEG